MPELIEIAPLVTRHVLPSGFGDIRAQPNRGVIVEFPELAGESKRKLLYCVSIHDRSRSAADTLELQSVAAGLEVVRTINSIKVFGTFVYLHSVGTGVSFNHIFHRPGRTDSPISDSPFVVVLGARDFYRCHNDGSCF